MIRKVNLTHDIPNTGLYFISSIDPMVMFNFNQTNNRAYGLSKSTLVQIQVYIFIYILYKK